METRSSPAKAGKKRRANASGAGNKRSARKAAKLTKKVRTRNTKRDSDLVQMGNKPGRMIVIEKLPKEGSALDPGSFIKQVSPSKLKLTCKATSKVDSSVANLPIPHVDGKAKSKTNSPSIHLDFKAEYEGQRPPLNISQLMMSTLLGCTMDAQRMTRVSL